MKFVTVALCLAITTNLRPGSASALDGAATGPSAEATHDTIAAVAPPAHSPLFSRKDVWFGLVTAGLLSVSVPNDVWLTDESTEGGSPGESRLASTRFLGNGALVVGGLVVAYGAGRLMNQDALANGAARVGAAVLVSGACALAVKMAVGRARPSDAPNDSDDFAPFRGDQSFPSGHATVAFAFAYAVDHETRARWVPWVVYPLATAVAWSRVHENHHWTSDVVAGAMFGMWTADKTLKLVDLRRR